MSRRRTAVDARETSVDAPLGALLDALDIAHRKVHGWQSIACVFHSEDVPSLRVNIEEGGFQCQACGASGGSPWSFLMLMENIDFPTAKRRVEELTGMRSDDVSPSTPPTRRRPGRRGYVPRYRRKVE